jgi:hypothetical protein
VDTVNVGSRAPTCPFLIWHCVRGVHCHKDGRRPQSGRVMAVLSYMGDHLPYILPLDLHFSNLTRQSTHSQISVYDILHHNSQLRTVRHNDHDTPFCFKTDSCLGPFTSRIIGFPSNPCRLSVL